MLFCCEAKTQTNLVYNGDFEIYDTCPSTFSNPWVIPYEIEKCLGWTAPTTGTSDYHNTCAGISLSNIGVPLNSLGFQYPRSGNGYCGFLAFDLSSGHWFEYVQTKFTNTMISGHKYKISFYISLSNFSQYGVSKIGAYISSNKITKSDTYPFDSYNPQIKNTSSNFLMDTLNWIEVSGEYTANGDENYITIGNYSDTTYIDSLSLQPSATPNSYYYIDDVSIIDITDIGSCRNQSTVPNIFTPNADGVNDVMRISDTCFKVNSLTIYNRWGNLIMDSKTIASWDGRTTSGEPCSDGIYYYIIETENKKEEIQIQKGFIQLIR